MIFAGTCVAAVRQKQFTTNVQRKKANGFAALVARKSLKLRLLVQMARKPLTPSVEMRFVMDMFSPSVYESTLYRVQEPIVPVSGTQAEDGERKALRDLAALNDRVLAARLIV